MVYLILTNVSLMLFFGIYLLVLKRLTFFQWNRIYLLSAVVISFVMPLLQYVDLSQHREVYQPLAVIDFVEVGSVARTDAMVYNNSWSMMDWIQYVYIVGVGLMLLWLGIRLYAVFIIFRKNTGRNNFSFFHRVSISVESHHRDVITVHERTHVKQGHSYDILFLEIARAFNWFNPIFYLYLKELKFQHECIADKACARDRVQYAELLVANAMGISPHALIHEFSNQSFLKRRIMMLFKNKSKKINRTKYVLILPTMLLISGISLAFNSSIRDVLPIGQKESAVVSQTDTVVEQPEVMAQPVDGFDIFRTWLGEEFQYSSELKESNVSGTVVVVFTIEKDGALCDFEIVEDIGYGAGEEVVRVLKTSEKWQPGTEKGKAVRSAFTLPVSLNTVQDKTADASASITLKGKSRQGENGKTVAEVTATPQTEDAADDKVFVAVEQNPEPQNGLSDFRIWFGEHYPYPQGAIDAGVKGSVVVSFIVEKDGSLGDFKIVKDLGHGTGEAAIETLQKAERWKPGIQNGRNVRVAYTIPFTLDLEA